MRFWSCALALLMLLSAGGSSAADRRAEQSLSRAIADLNAAFVANDAAGLERSLAPEWVVIDGSGRVADRAAFLRAIRSGDLVHREMRFDEQQLRRFGNTALWTARARGGGSYRGTPFTTDERSTDVFVRRAGRWVCVFTQLTAIRTG